MKKVFKLCVCFTGVVFLNLLNMKYSFAGVADENTYYERDCFTSYKQVN